MSLLSYREVTHAGISQSAVNWAVNIYTGHSCFLNTSIHEQDKRFTNSLIFLMGAYKDQLFFSKKYDF